MDFEVNCQRKRLKVVFVRGIFGVQICPKMYTDFPNKIIRINYTILYYIYLRISCLNQFR